MINEENNSTDYSTKKSNIEKQVILKDKTIRESNLENIKYWVTKRHANVNSQDKDGKTALWWAAFHGNLELVKFLLDKNADADIEDNLGQKPLHIAIKMGLSYKEPGEDSKQYQAIVELIEPYTKPDPEPPKYDSTVETVAEKLSQLGLNSNKKNTRHGVGFVAEENIINSEKVCRIS